MLRVNVRMNTSQIEGKVNNAINKSQFALDQQVMKDSNFYIPKDTGELERSSLRYSRLGEGHVGWDTVYARRLYYNPQYNFSQDVNPNARGLWFEYSKARNIVDWTRIVKSEIEGNL